MSIIYIKEKNEREVVLGTTLPTGKTQEELVALLEKVLPRLEEGLHGKKVLINGRITTAMSLYLGHKLAHISKEIYVYDPKEGHYVRAVWH